MGDQIGNNVSGVLYYVPPIEFDRVLNSNLSAVEKTSLFAAFCRINILYMIANAGSGHIGSSFSSIDIMSWIELNELHEWQSTNAATGQESGIFFSSKGHDAPALYSVWLGLGKLEFTLIHQLRRLNGLPGHPDIGTPNVVTNTGSLGMGISKAKGMIIANRIQNKKQNFYVLTGDGELQEGQFWESLLSAANRKMDELTVIIDHNKLQSDTLVSKVSDLGDLEGKLKSFGWHVARCNGNDLYEFARALSSVKMVKSKPKIIIADTVKGKGVSFMEHTSIDSDVELYRFHSGAPSNETYAKAVAELIEGANVNLGKKGFANLTVVSVERSQTTVSQNLQRLINAYSKALIDEADLNQNIVAFDADLALDTGLLDFQKRYPDRFIECGIAEQDMVSQAGGLALKGMLPIVHSFACFLTARPNEQIYNNATERRKIIYVGSLAGVTPAGPGHSHQAVHDISAISGVPDIVIVEPSCEAEVPILLKWAINECKTSVYFRLVSVPCAVSYELPTNYKPEQGVGTVLIEGNDLVVFAYGPVILTAIVNAVISIKRQTNKSVKVVNMPWLNVINYEWFVNVVGDLKTAVSIDNHLIIGGQGDRIADVLATNGLGIKLIRVGVPGIPPCGTNTEVLSKCALDADGLAIKLMAVLGINN